MRIKREHGYSSRTVAEPEHAHPHPHPFLFPQRSRHCLRPSSNALTALRYSNQLHPTASHGSFVFATAFERDLSFSTKQQESGTDVPSTRICTPSPPPWMDRTRR